MNILFRRFRVGLIPMLLLLLLPSVPATGQPVLTGEEPVANEGTNRAEAYYHFLRAKGFEYEHLYQEAVEELLLALDYAENRATILHELARLYQRLGRTAKALEFGRAAVEADPEHMEARLFLGRLYFRRSHQETAESDEFIDRATEQFTRALALDPEREDAYLDLAHIYRSEDDDEKALELLKNYLERSPFNERVLFAIGNVYWSKRSWDLALENYLKILEVNPGSIRAMLDAGDTYFKIKKPGKAVVYYLRALEENPDSYNILKQIGTCYEELMQLEEAEQYFERALELKPDDVDLLDDLGNVAFMQQQYRKAMARYLEVLEAEPDRMVTRFNLARTYKNLEENPLALVHLENLRQRLSGMEAKTDAEEDTQRFLRLVLEQLSNILVEMEDFDRAIRVLEDAVAELDDDDPEVVLNLARIHFMKDDLKSAIEVLDRHRASYPEDESLPLLKAEMYLEKGLREEGLAELERLEKRALDEGVESELWSRLASLYLGYDFFEKAGRLLDALTSEKEGKTALSLFYLARAHLRQDNQTRALEVIGEARGLFPDDEDFVYLEAEVRLGREELDQCRALINGLLAVDDVSLERYLEGAIFYQRFEQYELAEEVLSRAVAAYPEDAGLLFQRAANFERLGKLDQAEKLFRQLLERDPDNPPALNYLGYMLAEQGIKLDEAVELIGRALREDPKNGAYLDSMGWALYQAGMKEKAGVYLLEAVEMLPDDPVIHDHVGDYFLAVGKAELAVVHWRKSLDLGDDDRRPALEKKVERHETEQRSTGEER